MVFHSLPRTLLSLFEAQGPVPQPLQDPPMACGSGMFGKAVKSQSGPQVWLSKAERAHADLFSAMLGYLQDFLDTSQLPPSVLGMSPRGQVILKGLNSIC